MGIVPQSGWECRLLRRSREPFPSTLFCRTPVLEFFCLHIPQYKLIPDQSFVVFPCQNVSGVISGQILPTHVAVGLDASHERLRWSFLQRWRQTESTSVHRGRSAPQPTGDASTDAIDQRTLTLAGRIAPRTLRLESSPRGGGVSPPRGVLKNAVCSKRG